MGQDRLRRAVGILLVAVLAATGCAAAGLWQWTRHADRSAAAQRVEQNYDAPSRPLEAVLGASGALPPEAEWTSARLRGRYLAADPVTLRNRPVDGTPAVRLLHPFGVEDGRWAGRVLVVDRGWVPTADGGPEQRPAPPDGVVDLVVRLRPAEDASGGVGTSRQVRSIAPASVLTAAGAAGDPLGAYGIVVAEDGTPPAGVAALPPPETSLGNNLSYAFQWWVFALGALGGAVVLLRRDRHADAGAVEQPPDPQTGGTRRRRPTAEEEEDALLDAQLGVPTAPVRRGPA